MYRRYVVLAGGMVVLLLAIASICVFPPVLVLGHRNMVFLKATELQHGGVTTVKVSGICGHVFSVKKIDTKQEGPSITVAVYAGFVSPVKLPWRHDSGSFQLDLIVPDTVNEIRFGKEEAVIWRRGERGPDFRSRS